MIFYILRHGETDWNVAWRLQGSVDTPLNETGLQQAKEAAERLKTAPFTRIYTSPLQRAVVTAETIAEPHGLPVLREPRLTEMNFGNLEGTTPEQTKDDLNRHYLFENPPLYTPAGGGESFEALLDRCGSFLNEMCSHEGEPEYEHVLISCHGAVSKALQMVMFRTPLIEFWKTPPQPNCSVIPVEYKNGEYKMA